MHRFFATLVVIVTVIILLVGCTGRYTHPPEQTGALYVYVHNNDGSLRSRYVLSNNEFLGWGSNDTVSWNDEGGYHRVTSTNMEIHSQPVDLYEKQYQELADSDN